MKPLLAKSYNRSKHATPPDYALLTQHTRDVVAACKAVALAVGRTALYNAELGNEEFARFQLALRTNGWLQDLGKASSHYQEMVSNAPQMAQLLRHETISGLLVWQDARLRAWLAPLSNILLMSVWGALGHHRKFDERTEPRDATPLIVHTAHEDFKTMLAEMSADLSLELPPALDDIRIARDGRNKEAADFFAYEAIGDLQYEFEDCEAIFKDERERRLLALIKGFGIAADVAASAVAARRQFARDYSLAAFINESITQIGLTINDLSKLINRWAWKRSCDSEDTRDDALPPAFIVRDFQHEVAQSESHLTLAQAGCGSGKSLAAYMWAREWCAKFAADGRTNFRLFFCLPTTGTTTEHFKDYALECGIDDVSLTHSRASVDLHTIAETAPQEEAAREDERDAPRAARDALNAMQDKIESLALWSTPLVVTTADTVLGLMANARRAVYSLPAIMSGVIVFDEIHALDERMFGHLLVFLKNFPRLPVLLMTASLPDERRAAIANVRPDLLCVAGPAGFETLERYRIEDATNDERLWSAVEECVAAQGKVLWVRNRVEWANESYRECRKRFAQKAPELTIDVYHSRLRYKDRALRHRRVIDRFKREDASAILVATQVAEMSLDLSADLLITDVAPVPSLIQRMGRLNRRSTPDDPQPTKPAIICPLPQGEPKAEMPYDKQDLAMTARWLNALKSRGCVTSQRDLSEAFAAVGEAKAFDIERAEANAVFFSGLWRTRPGMTREEGYTISVILEADLQDCTERNPRGEPTSDWLRRYEVSIPIKDAVMKWERAGGARIAPSVKVVYDYDEATAEGTGAKWRTN